MKLLPIAVLALSVLPLDTSAEQIIYSINPKTGERQPAFAVPEPRTSTQPIQYPSYYTEEITITIEPSDYHDYYDCEPGSAKCKAIDEYTKRSARELREWSKDASRRYMDSLDRLKKFHDEN